MGLGYDGKLYILAFDHRGSFTKRFGIEGDPTPEETERIADGKHLIFQRLPAARGRGADPSGTRARRGRGKKQPQSDRLGRRADWLHEHHRKFLSQLLGPPEEKQLAAVGGDTDRY